MTSAASGLLGNYSPGTSWLHRLPAGAKLSSLFVAGLVVALWHSYVGALGLLTVSILALATTSTRLRPVLRSLRMLLLVALLLGAWHVWQSGWAQAVEVVADLLALVLMAIAVTASTPVDEILEVIARLVGPLRFMGVDPERVALAFSLALRAIPATISLAEETRDAARARGLERDPRARLTPLVLRTVAHGRATGEALHARGVAD